MTSWPARARLFVIRPLTPDMKLSASGQQGYMKPELYKLAPFFLGGLRTGTGAQRALEGQDTPVALSRPGLEQYHQKGCWGKRPMILPRSRAHDVRDVMCRGRSARKRPQHPHPPVPHRRGSVRDEGKDAAVFCGHALSTQNYSIPLCCSLLT